MGQREVAAYAPITDTELDAWEARAHGRELPPHDDFLRLIAEVRRLRRRPKARRIAHVAGRCGGAPTFAGTRIGVADVVALAPRYGWDLEQLRANEFPDLSLADMEAAVEYYRQHTGEIDAILRRDQETRRLLPPAPVGT